MSYEMKSASSFDCKTNLALRSSLLPSSSSPAFQIPIEYSPMYSQCGDLFNNIQILSRSLRRMHVDHAVTGVSAVVMEAGGSGSETKPEIDLILSNQSYAHFLKSCVHQQVKPIEGEDRTFWDSRTGCTIRIYVTGERVKVGRRSIEIPQLNMMPMNDEGIKSWSMEAKTVRESARKLKVAVAPANSKAKSIAA